MGCVCSSPSPCCAPGRRRWSSRRRWCWKLWRESGRGGGGKRPREGIRCRRGRCEGAAEPGASEDEHAATARTKQEARQKKRRMHMQACRSAVLKRTYGIASNAVMDFAVAASGICRRRKRGRRDGLRFTNTKARCGKVSLRRRTVRALTEKGKADPLDAQLAAEAAYMPLLRQQDAATALSVSVPAGVRSRMCVAAAWLQTTSMVLSSLRDECRREKPLAAGEMCKWDEARSYHTCPLFAQYAKGNGRRASGVVQHAAKASRAGGMVIGAI